MDRKTWVYILMAFLALLLMNGLSSVYSWRFDMTSDHRYTLSEPALRTVMGFQDEVVVDILLAGELPEEFEKLKVETRQLLESFRRANRNIRMHFGLWR
jgi:hypothetical protein